MSSHANLHDLPIEITQMIGAYLKSKDLGNLRAIDRDLNSKLLEHMANRISLPVEFGEDGLKPFKVFVETTGRLHSMSPFIRRIHFLDNAFVKYAQAFTLNTEHPHVTQDKIMKWAQSKTFLEDLDSGELDGSNHVDAGYKGFRHSKDFHLQQFPDNRQPYLHVLDKHVKEIADILRNHYPHIKYVGSELVLEQLNVLFCGKNQEARLPREHPLLQSVDWRRAGERDVANRLEFHKTECVLHVRIQEVIGATMGVYKATFMRPSFPDLLFLEAALGKQHRLSKSLQRLSITTQQSYRAVPIRLNGKAMTEFLLRCTELTRLHLRINGDGSKTPGEFEINDLISVLMKKGALPKLTHLRVDGGIYEEGELLALVQARIDSLKFLFVRPAWLCYSPGNPSILAKDMNTAIELCMQPGLKLGAFYIGLLQYGFEQSIRGRSLKNVQKRMDVRRDVMATARLLPTEDKLGRVAKDLRIGEIYRFETRWGKEACEEKQSARRQKVELKDYFEGMKFS